VIGSITPGKRADLMVVDRNLFALSTEEISAGAIAAAQAVMTIFDGRVVYET
jgi:predicted amidohydrolase YtcJ